MGIPAWGDGQFSNNTAWLLLCLCCFGVSGMHRIYLGDTCTGIVYCLTGGIFGIGDCVDMCMLSSMVDGKNEEIRNAVQQKANALASQPTIVVAPGQVVTMSGQYATQPQVVGQMSQSEPYQQPVQYAQPMMYSQPVQYNQPVQYGQPAPPQQSVGYEQPPAVYVAVPPDAKD